MLATLPATDPTSSTYRTEGYMKPIENETTTESRVVVWRTYDTDGNPWSSGPTREEAISNHNYGNYLMSKVSYDDDELGADIVGRPIGWVQRVETVSVTTTTVGPFESVTESDGKVPR